jgi:hypothetical protein
LQPEHTGSAAPNRTAELLAYAFAVVTLIVLGAVFRTPILNFLCGPAYVIAVVTLLTPQLEKVVGRR